MRFIYFLFLIFFTAFIQVSFPIEILEFRLDLLLLVLIYSILYLPIEQVFILAFISGFILDSFMPSFFGTYIITRLILAYIFGVYFKLMLIKKPSMAALGILCGAIIEGVVVYLLQGTTSHFFYYLLMSVIPHSILIAGISLLLFIALRVDIRLEK